MITEKDWLWFGTAMHLIVADSCRFHMGTKIDKFIISTVGAYFPDSAVRKILAKAKGIAVLGQGDEYDRNYFKTFGYHDVGALRKYETMVFEAKACTIKGCDCEGWSIDASTSQQWSNGYNKCKEAHDGHMRICHKVQDFINEQQKEKV